VSGILYTPPAQARATKRNFRPDSMSRARRDQEKANASNGACEIQTFKLPVSLISSELATASLPGQCEQDTAPAVFRTGNWRLTIYQFM
jgi:hypothetical protein